MGIPVLIPGDLPVLIPAAGMGRRLAPVTDWVPKALLPVPGGTPSVLEIAKRLVQSGFRPEQIHISMPDNPGFLAQFDRALGGRGYELFLSDGNNVGDALFLKNRPALFQEKSSPGFLLHYCDEHTAIPYMEFLQDAITTGADASLVACQTMPNPYGALEVTGGEVRGLNEKAQVSVLNWAGVGYFKWECLSGAGKDSDFSQNLIPYLLGLGKVIRAFKVPGPRVELGR